MIVSTDATFKGRCARFWRGLTRGINIDISIGCLKRLLQSKRAEDEINRFDDTNPPRFSCPKCGDIYLKPALLVKHIRVCTVKPSKKKKRRRKCKCFVNDFSS